jgi:hypothetical protein
MSGLGMSAASTRRKGRAALPSKAWGSVLALSGTQSHWKMAERARVVDKTTLQAIFGRLREIVLVHLRQ